MKIFQALVGYLALTALPFHPFAFASPLEGIDYGDGYVNLNTTQYHVNDALIKHVYGSIADSCQTHNYYSGFVNTTTTSSTQNHSDSGEIIEARDFAALAPPILVVVVIVALIVLSIFWVEADNPVRCNSFKL
jgi:hypothetical protein